VLIFPRDADLKALETHVVYLARVGVCPLLAGTMGEGLHLAHGERTRIVQSTRKALDAAGFQNLPIIVGAGGGSTRETIALCEEVAAAGADAAIVITPGYFAGVLANHRPALKEFYTEVGRKSPVPVIIYNCGSFLPQASEPDLFVGPLIYAHRSCS
jgi:4-hydroxy-2-oxoglutarate aldolase